MLGSRGLRADGLFVERDCLFDEAGPEFAPAEPSQGVGPIAIGRYRSLIFGYRFFMTARYAQNLSPRVTRDDTAGRRN